MSEDKVRRRVDRKTAIEIMTVILVDRYHNSKEDVMESMSAMTDAQLAEKARAWLLDYRMGWLAVTPVKTEYQAKDLALVAYPERVTNPTMTEEV